MSSGNSPHWRELMSKRRQVESLTAKQHSVVATALGLSDQAAAAAIQAAAAAAATSLQLPEQCSGQHSTTSVEGSKQPLSDLAKAVVERDDCNNLLSNIAALLEEMPYWHDAAALQAWLLLRSGKLEAAYKACEQPQYGVDHSDLSSSVDWRWWIKCQVKWHLGDLAAAQLLLQEGLQIIDNTSGSSSRKRGALTLADQLLPDRSDVQQLLEDLGQQLSLKEAGNRAVSSKRYDVAVEEYSKALAAGTSCGFAAVLHSNRAAAYQQLERFAEALADCGRAVALDPSYAKAYSR
jgi:tetratricopeptide (TPR) repeat protein